MRVRHKHSQTHRARQRHTALSPNNADRTYNCLFHICVKFSIPRRSLLNRISTGSMVPSPSHNHTELVYGKFSVGSIDFFSCIRIVCVYTAHTNTISVQPVGIHSMACYVGSIPKIYRIFFLLT